MPSPKQERAYAIVGQILEEDRQRPRVDPCSALPGRFVGDHRGLLATLTFGHRFNVGPVYGATRTGRRPIEASEWLAITITDRGIPVFAANFCGATVHITFYTPGPWECVYGVDWEGDDQRFQWGDPPIGDDLEGQDRLRENDLNLDPLRTPPPAMDPLRSAVTLGCTDSNSELAKTLLHFRYRKHETAALEMKGIRVRQADLQITQVRCRRWPTSSHSSFSLS